MVEKHNQLAKILQDTPGESGQLNIVVNSSCVGRIEEFTLTGDWKHYVEWPEIFFDVTSVLTDKHVPSVLTLMDSKMYALLRSISALRKPKELAFTEIVDSLSLNLDMNPINYRETI